VARVDLTVEIIEIDPRKAEYIRSKGVEPEDVAEVLLNAPAYFLFSDQWGIYDMIGPNNAGRFLIAGIQHVAGSNWRLVTAYWNDDGRAERQYLEA